METTSTKSEISNTLFMTAVALKREALDKMYPENDGNMLALNEEIAKRHGMYNTHNKSLETIAEKEAKTGIISTPSIIASRERQIKAGQTKETYSQTLLAARLDGMSPEGREGYAKLIGELTARINDEGKRNEPFDMDFDMGALDTLIDVSFVMNAEAYREELAAKYPKRANDEVFLTKAYHVQGDHVLSNATFNDSKSADIYKGNIEYNPREHNRSIDNYLFQMQKMVDAKIKPNDEITNA